MNDKEFAKACARIRKYVEKWEPIIVGGLGKMSYKYERDDNGNLAAEAICDWRYRHGSITFWMGTLNEIDDNRAEEIVVHELCHYITNPLRDREEPKNDEEEFVVTSMARILMGLR